MELLLNVRCQTFSRLRWCIYTNFLFRHVSHVSDRSKDSDRRAHSIPEGTPCVSGEGKRRTAEHGAPGRHINNSDNNNRGEHTDDHNYSTVTALAHLTTTTTFATLAALANLTTLSTLSLSTALASCLRYCLLISTYLTFVFTNSHYSHSSNYYRHRSC
jgi:hypothetical protein